MRVAVLVSGNGSNLQALLDACAARQVGKAAIALVVSNRAEAYALQRAKKAGVRSVILPHRNFPSREAYDAALHELLETHQIDFVCLAGFMRLLSREFVEKWHNRLINIHPSLLPAFKGRDVHERVLAAGVKISGCTVHYVRPEMDEGPIIVQGAVPVLPVDTPACLSARIQHVEHCCYVLALKLVAQNRIRVENEKVIVSNADSSHLLLMNPLAA